MAAAKLREQTRGVIQRIVGRHDKALVVSYMDLDGSWAVDGAHSARFGGNRVEGAPSRVVKKLGRAVGTYSPTAPRRGTWCRGLRIYSDPSRMGPIRDQ